MKAKISWIPKEMGGRVCPPSGTTYSSVAKFPEDGDSWPSSAWSVVVTFAKDQNRLEHFADVQFLSCDAPQDRLKSGNHFEIYEGFKRVARVQLI
jgi:hypothetical protein